MLRCVQPFGRCGFAIWTNPPKGLSAHGRLLKISGMYIFPCIMIIADVDGFPALSGDLFIVLINNFEVGDVGMVVVVEFTMDINCTSCMTPMFFHTIF